MNFNQRIEAFVKLGEFLTQFSAERMVKKEDSEFNNLFLMLLKCKLSAHMNTMGGLQKTMF